MSLVCVVRAEQKVIASIKAYGIWHKYRSLAVLLAGPPSLLSLLLSLLSRELRCGLLFWRLRLHNRYLGGFHRFVNLHLGSRPHLDLVGDRLFVSPLLALDLAGLWSALDETSDKETVRLVLSR